MKKLNKKVSNTYETVEAFACICSCGPCTCNCAYPIGNATNNNYSASNSRTDTRFNSMTN